VCSDEWRHPACCWHFMPHTPCGASEKCTCCAGGVALLCEVQLVETAAIQHISRREAGVIQQWCRLASVRKWHPLQASHTYQPPARKTVSNAADVEVQVPSKGRTHAAPTSAGGAPPSGAAPRQQASRTVTCWAEGSAGCAWQLTPGRAGMARAWCAQDEDSTAGTVSSGTRTAAVGVESEPKR